MAVSTVRIGRAITGRSACGFNINCLDIPVSGNEEYIHLKSLVNETTFIVVSLPGHHVLKRSLDMKRLSVLLIAALLLMFVGGCMKSNEPAAKADLTAA